MSSPLWDTGSEEALNRKRKWEKAMYGAETTVGALEQRDNTRASLAAFQHSDMRPPLHISSPSQAKGSRAGAQSPAFNYIYLFVSNIIQKVMIYTVYRTRLCHFPVSGENRDKERRTFENIGVWGLEIG